MTPANQRPFKGRLPLLAGGFVLLVCLVIVALSGWHEWTLRQAELRNAEVDMTNLARSLTQHAEDTFELTDTILVGLVDRLETDGTSPAAIAKIQSFLQLRVRKSTGRVRGIFVYDDEGRWLATTEKVERTEFNNSDREYFRYHRDFNDRRTLIGPPVQSRSGGQWIITASRRFNKPDGSFGGVALTTTDVGYFSEFYRRFDIGENGMIALLSNKGIMLSRSRDAESYIGRDLSDTPVFKEGAPAGSVYYFKSPLDGLERISFYQRSDRYPLTVLATKAEEDVLGPWRHGAVIRLSFVLISVGLVGLMGSYLVRYLSDRQRMVRALVAKEADFRLLAEQSSDMVMRIDVDGRVVYASPSCARVIGWDAAQIEGTSALAGVNPEDLPRVQRAIDAMKLGHSDELKLIYRNRHRDCGEIWVEAALRVTRKSDNGEINGVVAITRDMTEHKDLEEKLALLAAVDGLTGLANRRKFDERLQEEWHRSKCDGTPLSLLMMDVDHFKKYNDLYGHQAGDICLRSVAHAFGYVAHRPSDLAARYGGEEFALLLPNTDEAGCRQIGERLLQCLRALEIPHAHNEPARHVTGSIGGATLSPSGSTDDPAQLLADADRALYRAKEAGRNRLEMHESPGEARRRSA